MLTLAAVLISTGFSTASFAMDDDIDPATGLPWDQTVTICIRIRDYHICF
jgi:hypothetical protein